MNKKTIVYLNLDCFTDTDMTVLHHLAKEYNVHWFYIHESIKTNNRITINCAEDYARKYGITLYVCDPLVRRRSLKNIKFYYNIVSTINKIHPDLIYHCHQDIYWTFIWKVFLRCKHEVFGIHDVKTHSSKFTPSSFLYDAIRNLLLPFHENFLTFSPNQHDLLIKEAGIESRMVGMSCKYFGPSKMSLQAVSQGIKLLFFGRIDKYKGLDTLIRSMETLHSAGIYNLSLTIAGRGSYWNECEQCIKTKEMINVQIRFIDNAEIPDLISSHHFLAMPYTDATQSGPLLIAAAYEMPIVAPSYGCFSETYNDKAAILYPQGTLEEALAKIATMTQKEYESMKAECKSIKEACTEEAIAANYIKYFNSVIES